MMKTNVLVAVFSLCFGMASAVFVDPSTTSPNKQYTLTSTTNSSQQLAACGSVLCVKLVGEFHSEGSDDSDKFSFPGGIPQPGQSPPFVGSQDLVSASFRQSKIALFISDNEKAIAPFTVNADNDDIPVRPEVSEDSISVILRSETEFVGIVENAADGSSASQVQKAYAYFLTEATAGSDAPVHR